MHDSTQGRPIRVLGLVTTYDVRIRSTVLRRLAIDEKRTSVQQQQQQVLVEASPGPSVVSRQSGPPPHTPLQNQIYPASQPPPSPTQAPDARRPKPLFFLGLGLVLAPLLLTQPLPQGPPCVPCLRVRVCGSAVGRWMVVVVVVVRRAALAGSSRVESSRARCGAAQRA